MHPVFAQFIFEKCKPKMEKHAGLVKVIQEGLVIPESGFAKECQQYIPFVELIAEKLIMKEEIEKQQFFSNLAYVLFYTGVYSRAEELYKKSLEIMEQVLGENHPETAISYNNLAYLYHSKEKYEIIIEYYLKAYRILVNKFGDSHPKTQIV